MLQQAYNKILIVIIANIAGRQKWGGHQAESDVMNQK